jgi:hypothetical protein
MSVIAIFTMYMFFWSIVIFIFDFIITAESTESWEV